MKRIIIVLVVLLCGCKKSEEVVALSQMESSKWILTRFTSNIDPNKTLTECSKDIWEFKKGVIKNTVATNTGCYYSDNYNGKKYMIKENTIIFTSNNFDDPDNEAIISYSGNTMTWSTVLDFSGYGGPKYVSNLVFTKQ